MTRLDKSLVRLVKAYQERGQITGDVPAKHVAALLAALLQGSVVRHAVLGDVDARTFRRGLRALVAGPGSPPAASSPAAT